MDNNGGRVTTREFYEALLKQNDKMDHMEQRIVGKLDKIIDRQIDIRQELSVHCSRLDEMEKDVDKLSKLDKIIGGITGTLAIIAAAIAGYLGVTR